MADVRALLAAERQSRRISHPHLSYSKSGALTCTICNLNIKSEQLWPGHLKSANHRANVQRSVEAVQAPAKSQKRKLQDVEDSTPAERNYDFDSRKKPKPATNAEQPQAAPPDVSANEPEEDDIKALNQDKTKLAEDLPQPDLSTAGDDAQIQPQPPTTAAVDEDEWAAFQRDVASVPQHDYSSTTITAAPVSAAEIAAQQDAAATRPPEDEAEEEKEEESRRMEEEFEVMEEMEERIKRLKEKREALRSQGPSYRLPNNSIPQPPAESNTTRDSESIASDEVDEEDEEDDWYT